MATRKIRELKQATAINDADVMIVESVAETQYTVMGKLKEFFNAHAHSNKAALDKVPDNAKFTDTTYNVVNDSTNGLAPKTGGSSTTKYLRADGTWQIPPDTNTTYNVVNDSSNGLAPKTGGSSTTKYLRADGTWQVPPDTNTTYTGSNLNLTGYIKGADKSAVVAADTTNKAVAKLENRLDEVNTNLGILEKYTNSAVTPVNNPVGRVVGTNACYKTGNICTVTTTVECLSVRDSWTTYATIPFLPKATIYLHLKRVATTEVSTMECQIDTLGQLQCRRGALGCAHYGSVSFGV